MSLGKKSKGFRFRTRSILKRKLRERGKTGLSRVLYDYQAGEKIVININPSIHKGMPHRRYHGKVGTILDKRGRAYAISVTQGDAIKEMFIRPEHIKPFSEG